MNSTTYLFALFIGLISIFITYIDSCQSKKKLTKISYIKIFIFGTIISLLTSIFFNYGFISKSKTNHKYTIKGPMRQEILTGNPDF
jgi:hypothetical protein